MTKLTKSILFGITAALCVGANVGHAQFVRFYGGRGIAVRAPYVGAIRIGVGRPIVPAIVGVAPRPYLLRRGLAAPGAALAAPAGVAPRYAPGSTRIAATYPPSAPELAGQRLPDARQLARLDDGSLLNAVVAIMAQLDYDLGRFNTGAGWQRYLRLPDDALPPPSADGSVMLGWNSIQSTRSRLDEIAANPDYAMISGMESFTAARDALAEVTNRFEAAAAAQSTNEDATPARPAAGAEELPTPPVAEDAVGERSILQK